MKRPSKTAITRLGIALVVLVAAIVTGSLFAVSKRPPNPGIIRLSPEQQSASDYDKAIELLSNNDTATATLLLERAVAVDRNNTEAVRKLQELKKPKTPAPGPGPGTTQTPTPQPPAPGGPDPFLGDIDLKRLLPAAMEGFSLGSQQIIATEASVSGDANAANSTVTGVLWAVHDRGTEAAAQETVVGLSQSLYPQDKATVNIRGVTGYFGTDGTRFASIAFRRGRYAFEVIVTSTSPPASAKTIAEKAAAAFPAAP